jgi:3-isopropylmalate/(R)-2-methylmalate dehydratase small subunit
VIAESINGLFFRNCVAYAFPAMACPGVSTLFSEGDVAQVNFIDGTVRNVTSGGTLKAKVLPAKLLDLLRAGGIYALLEQQGIIEPQT